MLIDLDSPAGRDPVRVGSKAATLAAARACESAVLPGFVVPGHASRRHIDLGVKTLADRGSGGARLAVLGEPLDFADALVRAGGMLGDRLVARSSTLLDVSGEWSGAFASYVDITPAELPKAVAGCWASAFSVAALERQTRAGVEPGSFPVSVLVQPALQPEGGGWAELSLDGKTTVHGVKGSPAPLLQGWETGATARYRGQWSGDDLIGLIGEHHLETLRGLLESLAARMGFNRCEWALTDRIWVLQVGRAKEPAKGSAVALDPDLAAELTDTVRTVVAAPGLLGAEMVLPWAIAGLPDVDLSRGLGGPANIDHALGLLRELTEGVWNLPWSETLDAFERVESKLLTMDASVVADLRRLRSPDPLKASHLLATLRSLRIELADRGVIADEGEAWHLGLGSVARALEGQEVTTAARLGTGRWEPLIAAVILASQERHGGMPVAPGVGAGPRAGIIDPHEGRTERRAVVTAYRPTPNIASLLWDASGLVTASGSPAAHLFEAARALRIPAVSGVDLGEPRREVVAVDGHTGTVARLDLSLEL